MAEMRQILKYSVKDVESGQLMAAFATKVTATQWVETLAGWTGRKYEVKPS